MKGSAGAAALLALAVLALGSAGCATPQATGRRGLLEGVNAIKSSPQYSRRSNTFAAIDRSPAARAAEADHRGFSGASKPTRKKSALIGTLPGQPSSRPAVEIAGATLQWPVANVQVTSSFGPRGRDFHEGIDLKAPVGTPIYAAQDGTVIYSGTKIRGYGKLVVVRHYQQVSTIYAHNSKLLVKSGQFVRQGQRIAISGQTGHVTGPHLHFEVRDGLSALDPEELLPSSRSANFRGMPKHQPVATEPVSTQVVQTSQARSVAQPSPRGSKKQKRVNTRQMRADEHVVATTAPMPISDD